MKIKQFILKDNVDDYYTDLIVFDHEVELAEVQNVITTLKEKYKDNADETYSCDEVFEELNKLCPFSYYWIGSYEVVEY